MSLVIVTTAGLTLAATATITALGSGPAARAEAPGLAETDGALGEVTEPEVETGGKPEGLGVVETGASVGLAASGATATLAGVEVAETVGGTLACDVRAPFGVTTWTSPIVTSDATTADRS